MNYISENKPCGNLLHVSTPGHISVLCVSPSWRIARTLYHAQESDIVLSAVAFEE